MECKNWSENVKLDELVNIIMQNNRGEFVSAEKIGFLNNEPVWMISLREYNDYYGESFIVDYVFNAYGMVGRRKDDSLFQRPLNGKYSFGKIFSYYEELNQGNEINGLTYVEDLKRLHTDTTKEYLDMRISDVKSLLVELINKKIRVNSNIEDVLSEIKRETEDDLTNEGTAL